MKVLFFCGDKSRYGICHLKPLLESSFEIVEVVVATPQRWNVFRDALQGKKYYNISESAKFRFKKIIKKILFLVPNYLRGKSFFSNKKRIELYQRLKNKSVPIHYEYDVNSKDFIKKVQDIQPDLIISAAYPQIFRKAVIACAKYGAVNFHPSLLPKFRGAHPHYWAIASGEKKSGLTAHFMTENIDDGDIIAQIEFPIHEYNYGQLYDRIIKEIPNIVNKVEKYFSKGNLEGKKQDSSKATYFRNDRAIHHRIFWRLHNSKEICNLVRAGGAFCFFLSKKLYIRKCYLSETNRNLTNNVQVEEGTIIDIYKDSLVVKTKDACISIQKVNYNDNVLTYLNFVKNCGIEIGEKLE